MSYKTKLLSGALLGASLLGITDFAVAQEGPARAAQPAGDPFDDIVVTARRREESAQSVPVSVTAFSAAALEQRNRSEEHTSELQSLMRISYAVFCLKKKRKK